MAGGAASKNGQAIGKAAASQTLQVDPAVVPPTTIEQFVTGFINTIQADEVRDDDGKVTQAAMVELQMTEPPLIAQLGNQVVGRGFTRRITKLTPQLAIELGKSLQEDGELALASMKEQPLQGVGLDIAATPADVAAAAAVADELEQLKGGPGT